MVSTTSDKQISRSGVFKDFLRTKNSFQGPRYIQ